MTPQESTMLNDLVTRIKQTQLPEKDEEAEEFLRRNLAGIPDAQYILAQTVLVQNIALDQAKAQVQQLRQQLEQAQQAQLQPPPAPAQHTSFLGSLLGRHDQPVAPPPPAGYPPRPAAAPQYYPPAPAYAPDYAAPPPYAPPPPSGGSSFLRSAATTAAGVAAGALAFEGVESILHGFGHGGGGFGGGGFGGEGFGGFGGGGFAERPVEETVINNNYYDDPNQSLGGGERRETGFEDRGGGFGHDAGAGFENAGYDETSSDRDVDSGADNFANPNSDLQDVDTLDADQTTGVFDDSGNYDDGGGGDDSSLV